MANPNGTDVDSWRPEPPKAGWGDLLAVLAWTLLVLLIFREAVFFRGALFYFDVTEINYPYRDFLARELRQGRFSRWFPGLYCGMPLFSESQAGYLHPLKYLLYPWLDTWKAFNLDTVISVWLTGLGTFGWLRRHVGPRGALTGACVFGFSGFVWAHLIHTSMNNALTSVPFAVWAMEWAWASRRLLGLSLGGLAVAFQVFAGHLQDTLLTAGLLGSYGLYRAATESNPRDRLRAMALTVTLVGLGVATSAVQWVPSKELLDRSPRAGGLTWSELTYGSWHPELLPTLVVREAYGTRARDTDWMDGFYPYHEMNAYLGLTALALAVVGGAAYRDRWVGFWALLAVGSAVLMLGRFTVLFDFANRIPVIGSSRIPVRFHLWASLAVAALAAVGVDRLGRGGRVGLRGAFGLVGVLVLASVPILLYVYTPALTNPGRWNMPNHVARYGWLSRELTIASLRTLFLTLAGLTAMSAAARARSTRGRALACSALPLVVAADLLGAHWFDVPTVDPAYWTVPPASVRLIQRDPGLPRIFGVAERSAGEPGYASEPVDFLAVRDTLDWSLPPVWGLTSSGGETPIIPRRMVKYTDHIKPGRGRFDVESVTHLVTGRRTNTTFENVGTAGTAVVWRNRGALPRARLLGLPVYASGEAEAVAAIDRLGGSARDRLVVEDPDRPLAEDATAAGTAAITRDDPELVEVATDSAGPSYLFLADSFDPGWSAEVDGKPAPVRPAYLAFRAVFLGTGRHKVTFSYVPAGFRLGLAISLAGLATAIVLAFLRPGRPLRDEHDRLDGAERWPARVAVGLVVLLAVSLVSVDRSGHVAWSSRWRNSVHTFTWGAGIEAMKAQPRK